MIYQSGKFLRINYGYGVGNIDYVVPGGSPNALDGALDGLSVEIATPTKVRLGQTVGQAGDPAALTEDREIPFDGHRLFFGKNDGVSNVIAFDPDGGISVENDNGSFIQLFAFAKNFNVFMPDADTVFFDFNGAAHIQYKFSTDTFTFSSDTIVTGLGAAIRTSAAAVINFGANDYTVLVDTTAGDVVVNVNPATTTGRLGNIKKISADINSVTLTASSGLIFDIGAGTASISWNVEGESFQFQSDGTNIYIL